MRWHNAIKMDVDECAVNETSRMTFPNGVRCQVAIFRPTFLVRSLKQYL
jgi:hypothetical protein